VTTDIEIDGGMHVLVDMQDYDSDDVGSGPSTVPYSVVASWIGTTSAEHTLRISVPEKGGYAIVDGLMQVHAYPSSKSFKLTRFRFEALDNDINVTTTSTTTSATSISNSPAGTTSSAGPTSTKGDSNTSRSSSPHSNHRAIIIGVVCTVLGLVLIFLVWWFYIRPRGRRNTTYDVDTTYTGGAATPPIGDYNQDGYDGYGSSPRMVESAVPRSRNRAGRGRSLAPSSYQDGLASVAQSVVGGRPTGYA
jgi:hypothetical protein